MKTAIYTLIALLIGAVVGMAVRPYIFRGSSEVVRDTTVVERWKEIERPVVVQEWYEGTMNIELSDTTIIEGGHITLPVQRKVYSGENYQAWVSGFRPSLDSIHVRESVQYIRETVSEKPKRNEIAVGIEGGITQGGMTAPVYVSFTRSGKVFDFYAKGGYDLYLRQPYMVVGGKIPLRF